MLFIVVLYSFIHSTTLLVKFVIEYSSFNWILLLILSVYLKIMIEHPYLNIIHTTILLTTSFYCLQQDAVLHDKELNFHGGCLYYQLKKINLIYQCKNFDMP